MGDWRNGEKLNVYEKWGEVKREEERNTNDCISFTSELIFVWISVQFVKEKRKGNGKC